MTPRSMPGRDQLRRSWAAPRRRPRRSPARRRATSASCSSSATPWSGRRIVVAGAARAPRSTMSRSSASIRCGSGGGAGRPERRRRSRREPLPTSTPSSSGCSAWWRAASEVTARSASSRRPARDEPRADGHAAGRCDPVSARRLGYRDRASLGREQLGQVVPARARGGRRAARRRRRPRARRRHVEHLAAADGLPASRVPQHEPVADVEDERFGGPRTHEGLVRGGPGRSRVDPDPGVDLGAARVDLVGAARPGRGAGPGPVAPPLRTRRVGRQVAGR